MKRLLVGLILASGAWASSTSVWEMSSYQDFLRGRLENVSLSRDGILTLAPGLETLFATGQAAVWAVAQAPDGAIYAATGNRGRLYKVAADKKPELVWSADQPEIFALAIDSHGVVYAGSSPDGRVYRIENGKASVYFDPKAKYIWALAVGPDGALYVGTGDQGKIYRVTAPNTGEEYYSTGQSHVTSLAFDNSKRLLAGSEPNGILYRITAKDKAFVLYDSSLPEIRAIANAADGSIYAVGLGGSVARRSQAAQSAQPVQQSGSTPSVTATITVTADAAETGPVVSAPPVPDAAKAAAQALAASNAAAASAATVEVAGIERSAIYRIAPDNTVETLWSSKEENVYDLLRAQSGLLFSTDASGRIYRLTPDRKLTLVAQTNEGEVTRLLSTGSGVVAASGNAGKLYRLSAAAAIEGAYESPIFDAQTVARWGRAKWSATGRVTLRTRTGNSLRPDRTWSDWSDPMRAPAGTQVASPNARYIQWKAELASAADHSPELENFSLAFLPQNTAPVVRSILVTASTGSGAGSKSPASSGGAATAPYSITVTDTGDAGPSTSTGTPTQTLSRATTQTMILSWQAEDPDGDRLVYSVYFRGEGEREWKILRPAMHDNTLTLEGDALADGRYYFRVVASDREANAPDSAREAELVSSPVLIDNTPPVVHVTSSRRDGPNVVIEFEATDAASALRRAEYSIDAAPWMAVNATDGVIDSMSESFRVVAPLSPGEHVVALRAVDTGGNAGLAKVVVP